MELSKNPYGPYIVDGGPEVIPPEEIAIFVPRHNVKRADAVGALSFR